MLRIYRHIESDAVADVSQWSNNHYMIDSIVVPPAFRGQGIGSQLLKMICNDADKEGVNLVLQVASDKTSSLDDYELFEWYARYGFQKQNKFILMIRFPNPKRIFEECCKNEEEHGIMDWRGKQHSF